MTRDEADRICRELAHVNAIALAPNQYQRHMTDFVRAMVVRDRTEPVLPESVEAPVPKTVTRRTKG